MVNQESVQIDLTSVISTIDTGEEKLLREIDVLLMQVCLLKENSSTIEILHEKNGYCSNRNIANEHKLRVDKLKETFKARYNLLLGQHMKAQQKAPLTAAQTQAIQRMTDSNRHLQAEMLGYYNTPTIKLEDIENEISNKIEALSKINPKQAGIKKGRYQFIIGQDLLKQGKTREGLKLLKEAADGENEDACYLYGEVLLIGTKTLFGTYDMPGVLQWYLDGSIFDKKRYDEAEHYLSRAHCHAPKANLRLGLIQIRIYREGNQNEVELRGNPDFILRPKMIRRYKDDAVFSFKMAIQFHRGDVVTRSWAEYQLAIIKEQELGKEVLQLSTCDINEVEKLYKNSIKDGCIKAHCGLAEFYKKFFLAHKKRWEEVARSLVRQSSRDTSEVKGLAELQKNAHSYYEKALENYNQAIKLYKEQIVHYREGTKEYCACEREYKEAQTGLSYLTSEKSDWDRELKDKEEQLALYPESDASSSITPQFRDSRKRKPEDHDPNKRSAVAQQRL